MMPPLRVLVLSAIALGWSGCMNPGGGGPAPVAAPETVATPFSLTPGTTIEIGGKLAEVAFETEHSTLGNGDTIVIERVSSTSATWSPGSTLVVRGRYELRSRTGAVLALNVTPQDREEVRPITTANQRIYVRQGSGKFELTCEIPASGGDPRLSFYVGSSGNTFGGIYLKLAAP